MADTKEFQVREKNSGKHEGELFVTTNSKAKNQMIAMYSDLKKEFDTQAEAQKYIDGMTAESGPDLDY